MKTLTAVIIDDEPKACAVLNSLLDRYCPEIYVIDCFFDAENGIDKIQLLKPNIVFLDINMPVKSGFEVLAEIKGFYDYVIFTTAHDQYAIKAIKNEAFDYLLKPLSYLALRACMERLLLKPENNEIIKKDTEKQQHLTTITFHDKGGMVFVKTDEILYFQGDEGYTKAYLNNKTVLLSSKSINNFEENLNETEFIRVHRSYLVNISCVKRFDTKNGGELVLLSEERIPVARRKRQILKLFSI